MYGSHNLPLCVIDYCVLLSIALKMPFKRRRHNGRKSKFVTKRGLPFQLMKYADTKYNDEAGTDISVLSIPVLGPQLESLVNIGGGTSVNNRTGNAIQVSGFYGRLIYEATLTGSAQWIRVVVYQARHPASAVSPITDMVSPIDPEQFIIWYDRTLLCPQNAGNGHGVVTFKKKFKPYMKVLFDTSSGVSVQNNNLSFALASKTNMGALASWHIRTYFKDL